jgi:hypothetical protein
MQYSSKYFKGLTFHDVSALDYPLANTHMHACTDWEFLNTVLTVLNMVQVIHSKTVPSLIDILPVFWGLANTYATGKRSILVQVYSQDHLKGAPKVGVHHPQNQTLKAFCCLLCLFQARNVGCVNSVVTTVLISHLLSASNMFKYFIMPGQK